MLGKIFTYVFAKRKMLTLRHVTWRWKTRISYLGKTF